MDPEAHRGRQPQTGMHQLGEQGLVDMNPGGVWAQLDTGAFVSVTDQMDLSHDLRFFTKKHLCPVKLKPATKGSDVVPTGWGHLHVPPHNSRGH